MKKNIFIVEKNVIGKVDEKVFGSFVEHIGRSVYNGLYEPTHCTANALGFRQDVLDVVKELGVSMIRYPGGNFVSGYDWKKGIGKKEERKEVVDLAWCAVEPNLVGTDEFLQLLESINSTAMMAVNLGTGSLQDVSDLVQYCNLSHQGMWAKERILNGHKDPYNVKFWCLGNEMDGDWQLCSKTAEDYSKVAKEAAKIIKWISPDSKVIACGSSSPKSLTFPSWDRTVLNMTFDNIDYLSLHAYYSYPTEDHNVAEFLASAKNFDEYIKTVKQLVIDEKIKRNSNKELYLSVDEWNVWHEFDGSRQRVADWIYGAPLLENNYDYVDALVVSTLLVILINNCDYVKLGCLAQLCNVIAPILTEIDGRVLKQTTFYPFKLIGDAFKNKNILSLNGECETYDTSSYGTADGIYKVVGYDEETKEYKLLVINVMDKPIELEFNFGSDVQVTDHTVLLNNGLHSKNTFDNPHCVVDSKKLVDDVKQSIKNLKVDEYSFNLFTLK